MKSTVIKKTAKMPSVEAIPRLKVVCQYLDPEGCIVMPSKLHTHQGYSTRISLGLLSTTWLPKTQRSAGMSQPSTSPCLSLEPFYLQVNLLVQGTSLLVQSPRRNISRCSIICGERFIPMKCSSQADADGGACHGVFFAD